MYQANILASAKEGERSSLMARFGGADAQPICLATLTAGRQVRVVYILCLCWEKAQAQK